ncbi:OmpW/AlkL family protein [Yunchengibacter salinarum]|uniref:OmpW/AlkL family protein n=1 Tax=Yunchengibacter salinarum TaxID=3133399 RepID=UPI0035B6673C
MPALKTLLITATALAGVAGLAPAAQAEQGDFLVRLRAIHIAPDESSTIDPIGGKATVGTATVPELDITYFLTDRIAAELILATADHNVGAVNTALGDVDLASTNILPPTLTLQYHLAPEAEIRPYVGAGINYTFFYDESAPGGAVTSIDYSDSFGFALQAGADFMVTDSWFINADVKKLFLDTRADLNGGAITADVDIDPWIFGLGVGMKF